VRPERRWLVSPPSPEATRLAALADIPLLQAQLLINRGVSDAVSARRFISPRLADLLHPALFKDMADASDLILNSVERGNRIAIYGDYDADGLTATALLTNFFKDLGAAVHHHVPNRFREGYGLHGPALEALAAKGVMLVITVDCGTSDAEEILLAKRLGLDVVVTDHHQAPSGFKALCPVINPHQEGCRFPDKNLSGVGIAFFLAAGLRLAMRRRGWFSGRPEPDLRSYLDLVALGTVSDRVPLLGQNRILVHAGIQVMKSTRWQGLKALMSVSEVTPSCISADDLAFRLGPRLNAPGRIDDAEIGLQLLCSEDGGTAIRLGEKVSSDNCARQRMEQGVVDGIVAMLAGGGGLKGRKTLVFAGDGWPQGVLGIAASRIAEKYHRPVLVLSIQDGTAVGSGRSVEGFHLYRALCRLAHLLQRFGGHAYAAGFRTTPGRIELLKEGLEEVARSTLPPETPIPAIRVDGRVSFQEICPDMLRQLEALAPFGEGNPEPRFLACSARVLGARVVGGNHLRLRLSDGARALSAIGFGMGHRCPLREETVDMVFTPEFNSREGYEGIQLRVADFDASERASGLLLEDPGGQLDVSGAEDEEGLLSPGQR